MSEEIEEKILKKLPAGLEERIDGLLLEHRMSEEVFKAKARVLFGEPKKICAFCEYRGEGDGYGNFGCNKPYDKWEKCDVSTLEGRLSEVRRKLNV